MIKKLLFIGTITFSLISSAQDCGAGYTCIPDTNFEQALIDAGWDSDGTVNGKVLTADIDNSNRKQLELQNKGISDLTGVEAMTYLTSLKIQNNTINSLNLSNNTNIATLHIANNGMSELNGLENLTKLNFFNMSDNQITEIDCSSNTKLKTLYANNNNLETIQLNTTNSVIEILTFQTNSISSFDFSPHSNLKEILCNSNPLTSIDLSNNPNLTKVNCSSMNDNGTKTLTYFSIKNGANTNITNFNITWNNNLLCANVDDVNYSNTNWGTDFNGANAAFQYSTNCDAVASINEVENALKTIENPVKETINLHLPNEGSYSILNLNGQKIAAATLNYGNNKISTSDLKEGIYILSIESNNSQVSKKIIKL